MDTTITQEMIQRIVADRTVRQSITRKSHLWFFYVYFSHYATYEIAPFQKELFALTEDTHIQNVFVVAFRGSAKSTIMNLSYSIWSILGVQQAKFVLLLGQTQEQARQHLKNLKEELERNQLLRSDLGPFEEQDEEWRSQSIILPKYNAKVMAVSTETAVRGLRHGPHRPDLIIGDDLEDLSSVKTRENRDKTYQWLTSEVIPAGHQDTRLIVVGNLLHEDSLLMRLKKSVATNRLSGVFKQYPLVTEDSEIMWPGKYINQEAINVERKRIGNDTSFQREFMLKIVSDESRVVHPEWIQYKERVPSITDKTTGYRYSAAGIDLAISQKDTADYTAIVIADVFGWGKDFRIYIRPYPVNARMDFPTTLIKAKEVSKQLQRHGMAKLYIEEVSYQAALIQQLQLERYPVEGIKVHGQDKLARLNVVSQFIKDGTIVFPTQGAELLIQQLTGFGVEKHDDLVDAFTLLVGKIMEGPINRPGSLMMTSDPSLRPITAGLMNMIF